MLNYQNFQVTSPFMTLLM